jgi:hypothetical protein
MIVAPSPDSVFTVLDTFLQLFYGLFLYLAFLFQAFTLIFITLWALFPKQGSKGWGIRTRGLEASGARVAKQPAVGLEKQSPAGAG